jgi:hypothetical protein
MVRKIGRCADLERYWAQRLRSEDGRRHAGRSCGPHSYGHISSVIRSSSSPALTTWVGPWAAWAQRRNLVSAGSGETMGDSSGRNISPPGPRSMPSTASIWSRSREEVTHAGEISTKRHWPEFVAARTNQGHTDLGQCRATHTRWSPRGLRLQRQHATRLGPDDGANKNDAQARSETDS